MASEANEKTSGDDSLEITDPHKGALDRLSKDYRELSDKAQQLLTEKLFLENELTQLKKRSNRLEEELSNIRTPPLIIGYIQDTINEQAVVRSSNGTVFLVSINRRLDNTKIKPGTRVALNQDTLSVVEILSDSWDPLVSNAEIIDSPDVDYSSIGGLEKQIKELKQALADAAVKSALLRAHSITLKATNPENTTLSDMAEGIKNYQLEVLKECGHMIIFEKAFEMREIVKNFVQKNHK